MMEGASVTVFVGAAVLLNISPGPDLLYVSSTAMTNGRRVGVAAAFGIAAGAMVHVVAAALGLSAILTTSETAFFVVKWLGAGYLIYLGLRSLFHGGAAAFGREGKRLTVKSAFRQGVMVDLFNPKSALFFVAFLPQFTAPSIGHLPFQLLALGIFVILIGLAVEVAAAFGASRLTAAMRERPRFAIWLDRFLGCFLIGLGMRLALQQRS
jgi:threonine/homoserine/homoserine lactone efflux protein